MSRPGRRLVPRPLLWAGGALIVLVAAVVGCSSLVWSSLQVPDVETEGATTTEVAPASAAEGELTVRLDATARPAGGPAPEHVEIQPIVDLDASALSGSVLVTLEAKGTDAGPTEAAGSREGPPRPAPAWSAARSTSVQQVVDPGSGRLGLGSVRVTLPCPLGEPCSARWRYRIEPLTPTDGVTTVLRWSVFARAVYSTSEVAVRPPEGASIDVSFGGADPAPPSGDPVVLEAARLADGATLTVAAPASVADGVVRVIHVDGANGTAPGFFLAADGDVPPTADVTVGPSIWEVPFAVGACDGTACTVRLTVNGTPPPGSIVLVDARLGPELGSASIPGQVTVAVLDPP